ncbi:helix-turn-helix domain-containing protein [Saccharothrix isguenensis]
MTTPLDPVEDCSLQRLMPRLSFALLGEFLLFRSTTNDLVVDFLADYVRGENLVRQKPSVTTRGIGFELERLRRTAKLNLDQVSKGIGVSAATLSRLENGKRQPKVEEVASILTVVGVTGAERDRLLDQARGGSGLGLVEGSSPTVQSRTYLNFETRAVNITSFQLMLVPGLAQTAEYAYAAISALMLDQEEPNIEARVARRMARQAILGRPKAPQLNLIIAEYALRLSLGGPQIMARQVRHLVELSQRPNVATRIVPNSVVGHPGLAGQFVLLEFAKDSDIVFVEDRATGLFLDDPIRVANYRLAVEKLRDVALDEQESLRLMASIAEDHDGE